MVWDDDDVLYFHYEHYGYLSVNICQNSLPIQLKRVIVIIFKFYFNRIDSKWGQMFLWFNNWDEIIKPWLELTDFLLVAYG